MFTLELTLEEAHFALAANANTRSYVLSSDTETVGTALSFVSKATAREGLLDAYVDWLQD